MLKIEKLSISKKSTDSKAAPDSGNEYRETNGQVILSVRFAVGRATLQRPRRSVARDWSAPPDVDARRRAEPCLWFGHIACVKGVDHVRRQ